MKIIDQSTERSLTIFALVLVVIQFALDGGTPLTYYKILTLAVLIMAVGFLMITFVLEIVADLKILIFRVQLNPLQYSGLLLFLWSIPITEIERRSPHLAEYIRRICSNFLGNLDYTRNTLHIQNTEKGMGCQKHSGKRMGQGCG